jgi:hypothetical protein
VLLLMLNTLVQFQDVVVTKRQNSIDQGIESHPHSPNIRSLPTDIGNPRMTQFRTRKSRRPTRTLESVIFLCKDFGDSKVHDFEHVISVEKEIVRFNVPVDNPLCVYFY